jgi:3-oxosteroid 1-dehydrogenase
MTRKGRDEDFGRGDSAYDRFLGDSRCPPNPNLESLEKVSFYAMKVYPGDIGTKGGLFDR